jgi:hypothetical protein
MNDIGLGFVIICGLVAVTVVATFTIVVWVVMIVLLGLPLTYRLEVSGWKAMLIEFLMLMALIALTVVCLNAVGRLGRSMGVPTFLHREQAILK